MSVQPHRNTLKELRQSYSPTINPLMEPQLITSKRRYVRSGKAEELLNTACERTFSRGLKELLENRFIASKDGISFWTNPSASRAGDEERDCSEAGADAYIEKSVGSREFATTLCRMLPRQSTAVALAGRG